MPPLLPRQVSSAGVKLHEGGMKFSPEKEREREREKERRKERDKQKKDGERRRRRLAVRKSELERLRMNAHE